MTAILGGKRLRKRGVEEVSEPWCVTLRTITVASSFSFLPLGNGAPPRGSGGTPFGRGNVQLTGLPPREPAAGRTDYRGDVLLPDKRLPSRAASMTWRMASVTRPGCSTWM